MNYRHAYHAGNFADVLKHVVLIALMQSLHRKDKPACYIDTHAGIGYYDLFAETTQKTKEYQGGIEKVIAAPNPPPLVKTYLDYVHRLNNKLSNATYASLQYYPGSPMFASFLLRPHDRLIACELQPQQYELLREAFSHNRQAAIHHTDGFLGLKAFLPPKERRGVILIDPPFEDSNEFTKLAHAMPQALKRFESGIFAIWYPIKDKRQVDRFYEALKQSVSQSILSVDLTIYPDLPTHLNGSGLAIINPPWQFKEAIDDVLPWLWKALTINGQGGYSTKVIK